VVDGENVEHEVPLMQNTETGRVLTSIKPLLFEGWIMLSTGCIATQWIAWLHLSTGNRFIGGLRYPVFEQLGPD